MPMPGYVFRDGQPIPDSEQQDGGYLATSSTDMTRVSTSTSSAMSTPTSSATDGDHPTDSHALANADHDDKGAAQVNGDDSIKNLGWNEHPKDVPDLVGGLDNEELWTLIRRFNKQMYHVKATTAPLLGGLDLNIADEDEFSPDKLRANVERLYMTVIIGLMGFGKHIARLRSWREPRRTGAFAAAYAVAWILNLLLPTFLTTLIVLIVYPPSRPILFPPAPLALVDSSTGGVQSPKAGVLGSHDSATGAPEKHKGEAVEQEASNFVSGIGSIALSSATGKHEQGDPDSDPLNKSVPDPTRLAMAGADAKSASQGGTPNEHHDKTKQPMEDAMWGKMRPVMHVIGDISDGWERFANALSPTAPFPKEKPRLVLAGVLAPAVAVSLITTSAVFIKMAQFGVGIGFFSDPLVWRGLDWLNRNYPEWQKLLEIRNSILKGVPTNAQLTITLLRIGEANRAPLPPPPSSDQPPPNKPKSLNGDDVALDASHDEIQAAIHEDPAEKEAAEAAAATAVGAEGKPKHRHGAHILGFFKGTTATGVETKLGVDKVRAKIGSTHAKNHLGVLPNEDEMVPTGPVDFKGRYKGHKGWVNISTAARVPCVSWSKAASDGTGGAVEDTIDRHEKHVAFKVPVQEIQEVKKVGGLGWKAKIVVGWATGKTVADGLEIVDKAGNTWKLTAIQDRDELFNRLIAIGGQKWESW
ncbi:MAG: hypothetical protein L6R36_002173 [Xanthoria steineri]|nr:MAG: hypothetical protein L6R36_002173 [Xanthoria steineri]